MAQHLGGPSVSKVHAVHFIMKRHCSAQSSIVLAFCSRTLSLGSDLRLYEPSCAQGPLASWFILRITSSGVAVRKLSMWCWAHLEGVIAHIGPRVDGRFSLVSYTPSRWWGHLSLFCCSWCLNFHWVLLGWFISRTCFSGAKEQSQLEAPLVWLLGMTVVCGSDWFRHRADMLNSCFSNSTAGLKSWMWV